MSLQLPTILSPPTPCTPVPTLTSRRRSGREVAAVPFPGRLPFWASPFASRLANASGRIEFIIFLIMDWSFASGCSPPRLSATQFPSATDSQCSVRWGLPPHCWCALSGALARQLRARRAERPTLDVKDEYDAQDLLHALLRIFFKDVRPEEWTPSYAGSSSRMDFLLRQEEIVIEVKMTREGLKQKDLVDQLLVDIARYEEHPSCKSLICFVYDPDGRIGNPSAIIADIEKGDRKIAVRVFVQPEHS